MLLIVAVTEMLCSCREYAVNRAKSDIKENIYAY